MANQNIKVWVKNNPFNNKSDQEIETGIKAILEQIDAADYHKGPEFIKLAIYTENDGENLLIRAVVE